MVQESFGTWNSGGSRPAAGQLRFSPDSGEETQGSPVYEPVSALWAHRTEALPGDTIWAWDPAG